MDYYDLGHHLPTHHDVGDACAIFDGWWKECYAENRYLEFLIEHKVHEKVRERIPWNALPYRLTWLAECDGMGAVERWWDEQGRAWLWQKETHTPHPLVGHLLFFALESGYTSLARWALDKGWSPDVLDASERRTPLHALARRPPRERVYVHEGLFERLTTPFTVNRCTLEGRTPFSLLMEKHDRRINDVSFKLTRHACNILLENEADITRGDREGYTPLHHFLKGCNVHLRSDYDFLAFLLKVGAYPSLRSTCVPCESPLAILQSKNGQERNNMEALLLQYRRQGEAGDLAACLDERAEGGPSSSERATSRVRL